MPTLPKRHGKPWTDADEAALKTAVASDPEDWLSTEKEMAQAKPFREAMRGRPPIANPRQQISLRLDPAVISKFKATGRGWQGRINEVLRKAKVSG